ncbi:MAG: hypothetical protein RJQ09_20920 [Cyclobacteriaceae bacterium]
MKKILVAAIVLLIVGLSAAYVVIPRYAFSLITDYEPYTFEKVFENDTMRVNYGIYDNSSPLDYGYEFQEIEYLSHPDSIKLSGWFVEASKPTFRCIVILHGRTSNRLKTMKFLELYKEAGLDSIYNFFIPDLRNSGKSETASTMMGYEFAEDIYSTLINLTLQRKQTDFVIYAFSMGAMGTAVMLNNQEWRDNLMFNDIVIDKLIFDSPLTNVFGTIKRQGSNGGYPSFIINNTLDLMNDATFGFAENMRLSQLAENIPMPLLIIQGDRDQTTLNEFLQAELEEMNLSRVTVEMFENDRHVQIYQTPEHKERYTKIVNDFIRN